MVRVHIIPVVEMEPAAMIANPVRVCPHECEELLFILQHSLEECQI
jgi:hypothetical protein